MAKLINESLHNYDPSGAQAPWQFYGNEVPDGDAQPWKHAPVMSTYTCILTGYRAIYVKVANDWADSDWSILVHATGDFTISGTLTAGDLVVAI